MFDLLAPYYLKCRGCASFLIQYNLLANQLFIVNLAAIFTWISPSKIFQ